MLYTRRYHISRRMVKHAARCTKARLAGGPCRVIISLALNYCSAYVPSEVNLHSSVFPESKLLTTVTDLIPGLCEGPTLKFDSNVVAVFPNAVAVSV